MASQYTEEQVRLFTRRKEEGYDLADPLYTAWLREQVNVLLFIASNMILEIIV